MKTIWRILSKELKQILKHLKEVVTPKKYCGPVSYCEKIRVDFLNSFFFMVLADWRAHGSIIIVKHTHILARHRFSPQPPGQKKGCVGNRVKKIIGSA